MTLYSTKNYCRTIAALLIFQSCQSKELRDITHAVAHVDTATVVAANEEVADMAKLSAIDDPALVPPVMNTSPLPKYDYDKINYGMNIGIERTPKGRIWACWVGGGDNDKAYFVLATSDNSGATWSKPRLVIDPHDETLPDNRRTIAGNLWLDPLGRLWIFFDQSMSFFDGRAGTWGSVCENPDSENPVWSKPKRIWHGSMLNKPVVLSNGDWMLTISLWDRGKISKPSYLGMYHEIDEFRMANIITSSDFGKTWTRRGGIKFPKPSFDEACIIERKDGVLWITSRTEEGIWEGFSSDQGKTWSLPQKSSISNPVTRHFIRRLNSGRLLLIKHGTKINESPGIRSQLAAFLSSDDGKTWTPGLLLDERTGISYPDGFEAPDGNIYISYDKWRDLYGEILMACFKEEDIIAGKFFTEKAQTKIQITKAGAH